MKKNPRLPKLPMCGLFVAMEKRHARTQVHKDRRAARGGSRNKQSDYRSENF